jgi:DNA invertase Pin-like site-specific DNA recombinase
MIVGYARVSTADQNPEMQLAALKRAKCTRVFVEQKSGRDVNRPELIDCLKLRRKGDTLVVWKLDRLGRSIKDLIEIVNRLKDDGINFKSLTEEINTTTASGNMVFQIFAVLAEFERNLIRERTTAGLAVARARGRSGGAPPKTTTQQNKQIRALWESHKFTAAEIAEQFDISIATFFRRVKPKSVK